MVGWNAGSPMENGDEKLYVYSVTLERESPRASQTRILASSLLRASHAMPPTSSPFLRAILLVSNSARWEPSLGLTRNIGPPFAGTSKLPWQLTCGFEEDHS